MNLLQKIKSSVYDPNFYTELIEKEKDSPFKYFLSFILIVSLFSTVITTTYFLPKYSAAINMIKDRIVVGYPDELEVKIIKGQAFSNVTEPYFIKLSSKDSLASKDSQYGYLENFLVISTKKDFNLSEFRNYKTFALLTKDSLVFTEKDKVSISSLSTIPDITINKSRVVNLVNKISPYLSKLKFVFPVLIYFGTVIGYMFILVGLLVLSLVVWLIAKLRKINIGYKRSYRLSMYASTLPIILELVMDAFSLRSVPFLFGLVFVLVITANIKKA